MRVGVGMVVGAAEEIIIGLNVLNVGAAVGAVGGAAIAGYIVGVIVGTTEGLIVGLVVLNVSAVVGTPVGFVVGVIVGTAEGLTVGLVVGALVGHEVGCTEQSTVGNVNVYVASAVVKV